MTDKATHSSINSSANITSTSDPTTTSYDVIVIGAGAAGLMCAATAAARGRKVLVIDHANKMAKKVLMSGGGRCNFTNYFVEPENFISTNPHFCKSALSRYTQWDFISLVEKHQIPYAEKSLGQLFCNNSSKDIRDLLLNECQATGAKIQLKCEVTKIKAIESGFKLHSSIGELTCESLVIATGGLSIPTMGATGFGYQVGEQFGHKLIPTKAGLTPLLFDGKKLEEFKQLAGNSIQVEVSCIDVNNHHISFKEAILFTHKGLSGPAILQISSYWQQGKSIHINLLPQLNIEDWLLTETEKRSEINLKTLLASQFSQAIAGYFVEQLQINCKLKQIEHKQQQQVIEFLQNWILYPQQLEGYKVAEVTLGGIDTQDISSKTFESKNQNGLYFIGEVLDVTGWLGGFNFQWAWASGYAAGSYV